MEQPKRDVPFELNFEEDIKIIARDYVDYLPEGTNKEAFLKGLVKTLCNQ